MRSFIAVLALLFTLGHTAPVLAQNILESTDASRLNALIRAKLCDQNCRYGDLRAERYTDDRLDMLNGFKFYLIKSRGETCDNRGCPEGFMAINNRTMIKLAQGYRLNPKDVHLPANVAVFSKSRTKPKNALCAVPGRQLNTALMKQTFVGKTMEGRTANGNAWSETLLPGNQTRFTNSKGKVSKGEYRIQRNHMCFKYKRGEDFRCKQIYECTSGEGQFIIADQAKRITSVITRVSAGQAAPTPVPQADAPVGQLLTGTLSACRAIPSDLRRLKCYDALADGDQSRGFGLPERRRLMQLMNFRNRTGVMETQTSLNKCTLTIFTDAPDVRRSFATEVVINLARLDVDRSEGYVVDQDPSFAFVAQSGHSWPVRTINKSRNTERSTRNPDPLVSVAANEADLPEVERLLKALAAECQG